MAEKPRMKTISLKFADTILEDIDSNLVKYNYSTRTEFIREAIRDKLADLENKHFEAEIRKHFKNKKSDFKEEVEEITHDVFKELEKRFG